MVIVMPTFTPCQQAYPPAVRRFVFRNEGLIPILVRCAIDEPRDVVDERQPNEDAPNDPRPATYCEQHEAQQDLKRYLGALEKLVIGLVPEVGCITLQFR